MGWMAGLGHRELRFSPGLLCTSQVTSHQPTANEGQVKVFSRPDQHLLMSEGTCRSTVTLPLDAGETLSACQSLGSCVEGIFVQDHASDPTITFFQGTGTYRSIA